MKNSVNGGFTSKGEGGLSVPCPTGPAQACVQSTTFGPQVVRFLGAGAGLPPGTVNNHLADRAATADSWRLSRGSVYKAV